MFARFAQFWAKKTYDVFFVPSVSWSKSAVFDPFWGPTFSTFDPKISFFEKCQMLSVACGDDPQVHHWPFTHALAPLQHILHRGKDKLKTEKITFFSNLLRLEKCTFCSLKVSYKKCQKKSSCHLGRSMRTWLLAQCGVKIPYWSLLGTKKIDLSGGPKVHIRVSVNDA